MGGSRRDAPWRQASAETGGGRTRGRDDARRTARRGEALNRPGDGKGRRGQPPKRAAHLGGAWFEAASCGPSSCRTILSSPPRLEPSVFNGIVNLQTAINRYLAETSQNPKPFTSTADPHAIIEKARRGKQVLEVDPLAGPVEVFELIEPQGHAAIQKSLAVRAAAPPARAVGDAPARHPRCPWLKFCSNAKWPLKAPAPLGIVVVRRSPCWRIPHPRKMRHFSPHFQRPQILADTHGVRMADAMVRMAGGLGFEPRLAESEFAVLPLDDPPSAAAGDAVERARTRYHNQMPVSRTNAGENGLAAAQLARGEENGRGHLVFFTSPARWSARGSTQIAVG